MPKTLAIEVKTVHLNVTALAREAKLPEAVAESAELLAFTSLVVDAVMEANGAHAAAVSDAQRGN